MKTRPLKIALGDLRHDTTGRHSTGMPIGIAYIASYLLARVDPMDVEIRFYDSPHVIIEDIRNWKPSVIGLSSFCWNSDVSHLVFKFAKKILPKVICIAGGPEFPDDHEDCKKYLLERPGIDFFVCLEGEIAFTQLLQKILIGKEASHLKSEPQDGIMAINPNTRELVVGEPIPRLMALDEIPSPYLTGLMDQWFDGCHTPSLETTRGCPFSCGFCFAGRPWFNNLNEFSTERIRAELTYIAKRMTNYTNIPLSICDANYGMFARDEEVAEHIRFLQDTYGWPRAIEVTTGKANYDRILRIASRLRNQMQVTCSLQSLNPKTLKVIRRNNIPLDEYKEIQLEIKRRGMMSVAELIAPLPEETKESFFSGVKAVAEAGVERIIPYTTMTLKQTYIASKECRRNYGMETKFRIIPHGFGEYLGEKCFETEEVCVATNTMPFEDYLECRGFAFISSLFTSEQFDVIHRHIKELKLNAYDYLYQLWESVKSKPTELAKIYEGFIQETKNELWNSKDDIYQYFTNQESYEKLLSGELGDNLLRKYSTEVSLRWFTHAIEMAYSTLRRIGGKAITSDVQRSLDAAREWMIKTRDIGFAGINADFIKSVEYLPLSYDVLGWYNEGADSAHLTAYERPVHYKYSYHTDQIEALMNNAERLYGKDLFFQMGKIIENQNIRTFWRGCELILDITK